jgi:hypothetical protein
MGQRLKEGVEGPAEEMGPGRRRAMGSEEKPWRRPGTMRVTGPKDKGSTPLLP